MNLQKIRLGEVCKIGRGSSPRPIKDERYFIDGDIPWVKIADATASGKYIYNTKMCVNEYGAYFSRQLKAGSLIFPASGTLGIPRFLGIDACVHDGWLYFDSFDGIDPEYLYYTLITLKDYYISIAYGAAIQNINTDILRDTFIFLPDLSQQKKIAKYLCNYDELIENNRKRIDLLEESARLLYQEWFVKFRFPEYKDYNFHNELPEKWNTKSLNEVCIVNRNSINKNNAPEVIKYIDISSVDEGKILQTIEMPFLDAPGRARRVVQHGDILWSCVRPNRRSYALLWNSEENVIASTGFAILTAKDFPFSYLYFATTSDEFVAYLTNRAKGAAYPAVTGKDFEEAPLLCPTQKILKAFDDRCLPLLEQKYNLEYQNNLLIKARDELLPKLISGQIKV